jgi:hypothetical protein
MQLQNLHILEAQLLREAQAVLEQLGLMAVAEQAGAVAKAAELVIHPV